MAVSINDVYQTTLTLLNKEQRGYVTPTEFNHIAGIVQNEIFEKYFIDSAVPSDMDSELANIGEHRREKLQPFITTATIDYPGVSSIAEFVPLELDDLYRLLDFYPTYTNTDIPIKADRMDTMMSNKVLLSRLTYPTIHNPIVTYQGEVVVDEEGTTYTSYRILPTPNTVSLEYIRTPKTPTWIGTTINGQIVPNTEDIRYQDFELHPAEYSEVVARVLLYFGLNTRSDEVIGIAQQKEQINSSI